MPDVVDAGEVVLGVDVDDAGGVVVVTPKTHRHVSRDCFDCPTQSDTLNEHIK